jgi:hypothetical protein
MAKKFLTNIDLNLSELQNAVIQNLASDPTSGNTDGRIYYNTVADELRVYANGSWSGVGSGDITDIQGTANEVTVSITNGVATISLPATINADLNGNAATATTATTANGVAANSVALGTDTTGNYVSTISGTADQVSVSGSGSETAAVTLSLPQSIATTSSPTFAGATLDAVQVGITAAGEIDTSSGNLTIDSAGGTTTLDDNVVVTGNLTVQGTTTTLDTQTLNVEDNIITLNYGQTGTPTLDSGIEIERGDLANVTLKWNETNDTWQATRNGTDFLNLILAGDDIPTSDITDFTENVQDAIGTILVDGTTVDFTYNDGTPSITAEVKLAASNSYLSTGSGLAVDISTLESKLVTDSFTKKYSASIGNASATSFAVTHNLNTRDVVVNVYDNSTYETVEVDVTRTDANNLGLWG